MTIQDKFERHRRIRRIVWFVATMVHSVLATIQWNTVIAMNGIQDELVREYGADVVERAGIHFQTPPGAVRAAWVMTIVAVFLWVHLIWSTER